MSGWFVILLSHNGTWTQCLDTCILCQFQTLSLRLQSQTKSLQCINQHTHIMCTCDCNNVLNCLGVSGAVLPVCVDFMQQCKQICKIITNFHRKLLSTQEKLQQIVYHQFSSCMVECRSLYYNLFFSNGNQYQLIIIISMFKPQFFCSLDGVTQWYIKIPHKYLCM
jgi:hypothetical protein